MRAAHTYRHMRRRAAQITGFPMAAYEVKKHKHTIGDMELVRLKLAPIARLFLMTGERSQSPSGRAVRKTVRHLLAEPMHAKVVRHLRGSWRSWPSQRSVA